MTADATDSATQTSGAAPAGLAGRQHASIADLVQLAGRREADIDAAHAAHAASTEAADSAKVTARAAANTTADAAIAGATKKLETFRQTLAGQHADAVRKEQRRDRGARDAKLAALDERQKDLKKRIAERSWLADAQAEAGESFPKQEFERVKAQAKTALDRLATIETEARRIAGPRVPVPAVEPDKDERAAAEAAGRDWQQGDPPPLDELTRIADETEDALGTLKGLTLHATVRLGVPIVLWLGSTLAGAGVGVYYAGTESVDRLFLYAGLGTLPGLIGVGLLMLPYRWLAIRESAGKMKPIAASLLAGRLAAVKAVAAAAEHRRRADGAIAEERDAKVAEEQRKHEEKSAAADEAFQTAKSALDLEHERRVADLDRRRDEALAEAVTAERSERDRAEAERAASLDAADTAHRDDIEAAQAALDARLSEIESTARATLVRIARDLEEAQAGVEGHCPPWNDARWEQFSPPTDAARVVRIGGIGPSLEDLRPPTDDNTGDAVANQSGTQSGDATVDNAAPAVSPLHELEALLPPPAVIDGPGPADTRGSLLLVAPESARDQALDLAKDVMLRLETAVPAGKLRLTMIDPVGLGQAFAGFMRLADHDEKLVTSRIWTESRHIEQRLTDLTEHMETVIQKYLRTEYPSIEAYNEDAGEIAEPYRYLVISEFPKGFTDEAARRLASILESGPRCGVYTIIHAIPGAKLPETITKDKLEEGCVKLVWHPPSNDARDEAPTRWRWDEDVLRDLPLDVESWPGDETAARLLETVGAASKDASRVEVPFQRLLPPKGAEWTADSSEELAIPLGRAGATKIQHMTLGRGTSQHALIAGKTGSGKSTLLHVMITSAAQKYAPDQLEFYLVDFKKGVEFKAYTGERLPHVRAVAIESDREFGLSVLQRLDDEIKRRGDLFRDLGAQNIAMARAAMPDAHLPRILLVIDEFQEFFTEDDKIGQDAALLLDRLVRQGRAFGMHVFLGSQTLSGAYTLARSTMSQMGVRIALQCSETDSYVILSEDNAAARLLSRPGEAIYNDSNGAVEGNNPFQVAWLPDAVRDSALEHARTLADERNAKPPEPQIVFEGSVAADLERNHLVGAHMAGELETPKAPVLYLGDPVAIKEPTGAKLRRQASSNLIILGQQDEVARALIASSLVSIVAQLARAGTDTNQPRLYFVDATPPDDPSARTLLDIAAQLEAAAGFPIHAGGPRDAARFLAELDDERQRREDAADAGSSSADAAEENQPWYLVLHGLQRLRSLRKAEDDFSFSFSSDADDDDAASSSKDPAAALQDLLKEGSALGLHVAAWCDTYTSLTRTIDRRATDYFELRALMQMSANDSSAVIESPAAGRLGQNRMVLYNDEQGTLEKFRPYRVPSPETVQEMLAALRS